MSSSLPLALAVLLGASAAAWAADQPGHGGPAAPATAGEHPLPFLELHLGRTSAFGHSPAAPPPAYGELGIDIDPRSGVSLVPSYRIVLDDGDEGAKSVGAQILKLGVRMRF